ncbi:hypothetical protein Hanom_Chr12g01163981 [Helianthus anomalus]
MHGREMGAKDKFKDEGSRADAYVENALFKRLSQRPSECTVIPEGALVMAGMSLLWHDIRAADRVLGEQEPDVLKIHLEQFLLLAMPANPSAYISRPPPNGGSGVSVVETKKPIRVKVTGRKYMATGGHYFRCCG